MTSMNITIALISPLVALTVAFFGIRRSNQSDKVRAFFEMYDKYLKAEVRAGRKMIHLHVSGKTAEDLKSLDKEVLSSAAYTLAVMNAIAIACAGNHVDTRLIARSMGRSYVSTITAAAIFIQQLEHTRGYRPYIYAEQLSRELVRHHNISPPNDRETSIQS